MRAIAIDDFGTEPYYSEDLPKPHADAGEVMIRIHAAGVNPLDWKAAEGFLKDSMEHRFPVILGFDCAGVIEEVDEEVARFNIGDEVYGMLLKPIIGGGTYAENAVAPATMISPKPATVGFAEAAALPMAGLTALECVKAVAPEKGDTVLIIGATGGVGTYAVQMAARRGATVIATAREDDERFVRELGAAETVDYTRGNVVEAVRSSRGEGIDAVIDVVSGSGEGIDQVAGLLTEGGRLASTLHAADVDALANRGVTATNVGVQPDGRRLEELARMVDDGELAIRVEQTFPLEKGIRALEETKSGHARGKTVISVT